MKPLFVKITLFDPTTDPNLPSDQREFGVFDGIEIEIVKILLWNPNVEFESLVLTKDQGTSTFIADNSIYDHAPPFSARRIRETEFLKATSGARFPGRGHFRHAPDFLS